MFVSCCCVDFLLNASNLMCVCRSSPSGAPQKSSPRSISSKSSSPQASSAEAPQKVSPRVVRQLKTGPRFLDPTASSSNQASRALKEKSPKVTDHKSPRSPLSEKKRPSKIPELESQISQLEHDLKVVKDQLISTEAQKKQALEDAEESNQQLSALSLKLEELQKHLSEHPSSDEVMPEEQKFGSQSELEAIKKQASHDSAALASALDEINQLKAQLEMVAESEPPQPKYSESEQEDLLKLKAKLSETLLIVEEMKQEVMHSKESEAQAQALVGETLAQLETAKKMAETLRTDGLKTTEEYNTVASELEQSRARVSFLEDLVSKKDSKGEGESQTEVSSLRREIEQLRSVLEAGEIRYNEERSRNAEQMQDAKETAEKFKSVSSQRETELEVEIRRAKYKIEELKANLMDKETELQGICEENESLTARLESSVSGQRETELEKKFRDEIEALKASLAEKEAENETANGRRSEEAESEAATKASDMAEEIERSKKKAERVGEELEAAQAANAEMEGELRRLKVQSDQWRKAAEAAAAMLSAGNNNGQGMERTGSMDSHYSPRAGKMSSPYADELDEEMMKKKNGNKMRKFGVLWKKPQK